METMPGSELDTRGLSVDGVQVGISNRATGALYGKMELSFALPGATSFGVVENQIKDAAVDTLSGDSAFGDTPRVIVDHALVADVNARGVRKLEQAAADVDYLGDEDEDNELTDLMAFSSSEQASAPDSFEAAEAITPLSEMQESWFAQQLSGLGELALADEVLVGETGAVTVSEGADVGVEDGSLVSEYDVEDQPEVTSDGQDGEYVASEPNVTHEFGTSSEYDSSPILGDLVSVELINGAEVPDSDVEVDAPTAEESHSFESYVGSVILGLENEDVPVDELEEAPETVLYVQRTHLALAA